MTLITTGLLMAGCAGCDHSGPVDKEIQLSTPLDFQTFEQQIREVRQGQRQEITLVNPPVREEVDELISLAGKVRSLNLDCESLDRSTFEKLLDAAVSIERLKYEGAVSDADLEIIADCKTLKVLNLPHGAFTDTGLDKISRLPHLELLRFHSANVTDAGLKSIAKLSSLRFLHLIDVPVTDAGLETVATMNKLESFYLDGGKCTDEGLSGLINKRFDLHFHWNDLHLADDPNAHAH